jgi:hypothetical protein
MTTRAINIVLVEAFIIGLMNLTLIYGIKQLNLTIGDHWLHLTAGALIHILFEYTGGNKWWCQQTYKL